jgi:hypothetical protein
MKNETKGKLEQLQELLIDALIKELKDGDTTNISVANTLLTANKIVVPPEDKDDMHNKVKKVIRKKKDEGNNG